MVFFSDFAAFECTGPTGARHKPLTDNDKLRHIISRRLLLRFGFALNHFRLNHLAVLFSGERVSIDQLNQRLRRYFFTSAIAGAHGGEAHSAEAVRHRMRLLIDAEGASDILSDDTIVEKLRSAGIDIARRTVAKYREAMRIPSSVERRRKFNRD